MQAIKVIKAKQGKVRDALWKINYDSETWENNLNRINI